MAKWLLLFALLSCPPLLASKLVGQVYSENGRPVKQVPVVVMHELSPLLQQQTKTDRNGKYTFTVVPGPYRVLVLQPGRDAHIQRVLLVHEFDKIHLKHQISGPNGLVKNGTEKLKELLRTKSRDPFKDVTHDPWIALELNPHRDDNLVGSVKTGTRQGYEGDLETLSSVALKAHINDQVMMHSHLASGNTQSAATATMQIKAGLHMDLDSMALAISAETIHDPDTVRDGESKVLTLGTHYGRELKSETRLSLTHSELGDDEQEEIALKQVLSYEIGTHQVNHGANLTGWDHNGTVFARHATLDTQWRHAPDAPLYVRGELGYLSVPDATNTNAKLWLGSDMDSLWNRLSVKTRIGMCAEAGEHSVVQQHSVDAAAGRFNMQASYRDDTGYQPYATRDLFGMYMVQPLTPYSNEGFYRNRTRELGIQTQVDHGYGWGSTLSFTRADQDAALLYNHGTLGFKEDAGSEFQQVGYAVEAHRMGARLELIHSLNRAEDTEFASSELAYGQTLMPMRSKGMIFQFELRMKNNPAVPAWWLLEDGPWLAGDSGLFYEGQLSLQF